MRHDQESKAQALMLMKNGVRFDKQLLSKALSRQLSYFQYCRHDGCGSGQMYNPHEDNYIICGECGGETCVDCDRGILLFVLLLFRMHLKYLDSPYLYSQSGTLVLPALKSNKHPSTEPLKTKHRSASSKKNAKTVPSADP